MGEWTVHPFGDILINGTRNGVYKTKEYHGHGVKIVNMGELFANPRLRNVQMKRVVLSEKEFTDFQVYPGDLLFARRSLVAEGAGKCSVVMDVGEPTTFESSIIRARPDPVKADSLFLYYFFKSPHGVYLLGTIRRQVAVSGITGTDLVKLEISLPPLFEQHAIAHILGTLDDKIEINRRMNETLEGIARALFKSWFIDFDPVRAKTEGRQPFGMNQETANLFPDQFEDSELGEIPKGWTVRSIYDIADVRYGTPFSSKLFNSDGAGYPLIRIRDLESQNPVIFTQERIDRDTVIHAGDIVVGMDGEFNITTWYGPDSLLNQRVCSYVPKEGVPRFFLKYAIETPISFFERSKVGTTVIHLGKADIDSIRILVPQLFLLTNFEEITKDIYNTIIYNNKQNNILINMRDILLPKLISGDIQVDPSRFGFGLEGEKVGEV